jgi:hypothetical protein
MTICIKDPQMISFIEKVQLTEVLVSETKFVNQVETAFNAVSKLEDLITKMAPSFGLLASDQLKEKAAALGTLLEPSYGKQFDTHTASILLISLAAIELLERVGRIR